MAVNIHVSIRAPFGTMIHLWRLMISSRMLLLSFHLHFKLWNYNFTFPGTLLGSGGKCLPGKHFKIIAYKIRISCTFLRKISSISFFPSVLLRVSWVWRSAFTWKMAQSFLLQIRISRTFLKIHLISFFFSSLSFPSFLFIFILFYFSPQPLCP